MKWRIFLRFWFPVLVYSGMISYVSSLPRVTIPGHFVNLDKLIHIVEFIPLGYLWIRALGVTGKPRKTVVGLIVVAMISLLYGGLDEWHQSFVAGREATFYDALADTIGGFLGAVFFIFRNKSYAGH